MARNTGTIIQNNLSRGLITEATGLNFPDNAATSALNVVFKRIGSVRRRLGFDIEGNASTVSYTTGDGVVHEFLWTAVADTGGFTFLVLQLGGVIHFFEMTSSGELSANISPKSIALVDYLSGDASMIPGTPVSFDSGAGYLFIAHPQIDPIIIRWNEQTLNFEAAQVQPRVRDYEGLDDTLPTAENPVNLSSDHHYNLRNQGWNKQVLVGEVDNEKGTGGSLGGTSEPPALIWVAL